MVVLRSIGRLGRVARQLPSLMTRTNLIAVQAPDPEDLNVKSFSDFRSLVGRHARVLANPDSTMSESMALLKRNEIALAHLILRCLDHCNMKLLLHNKKGGIRRLIEPEASLNKILESMRGAHDLDLFFYGSSGMAFSGRVYFIAERESWYSLLSDGVWIKRFRCFDQAQKEVDAARSKHAPYPVDAVVTWVNDQCPVWQDLWNKTFPGAPVDADRHSNNEELKYCLRSIFYNMPWINKVFVVTNCLRPEWMSASPRIEWVDHAQIFPEREFLPTFNSHAIEACLHRIPDLSEHFVYFNDDFFLTRMAVPEQFFPAADTSIARLEPYGVVHFDINEADEAYLNAARLGRNLLEQEFGYRPVRLHQHVPYALRKSVLQEIDEKWKSILNETRSHRLRHIGDISLTSFFYHHYAIAKKLAIAQTSDCKIYRDTNYKGRLNYAAVRQFDFICINDGNNSGSNAHYKKASRQFLEKSFPFPAEWEKIYRREAIS